MRGVILTSVFALAAACGGSSPAARDAAGSAADAGDAIDGPPKAAACAARFGSGLTPAFGRYDGTILAVVPPGDEQCAEPNSTHLVLQATAAGVAYRMVIDVLSNEGDPDVWLDELDAPLVGSAWAEGWHTGIPLSYPDDLHVASTAFVSTPEAALVTQITGELDLGAHVSVFATATSAEPDSAHLVHRSVANQDGAIVIRPDGDAPHWLLMKFGSDQF